MQELKRKLIERIAAVRERIGEACAQANRSPDEVCMVAVTKYLSLDVLKLVPDCGLTDLGENRAQELTNRAGMIHEFLSRRARDLQAGAMPRPHWHMIGHVQRNKVALVLPWADLVHSVDSLRLAEEIDQQARTMNRTADVLMQVNTAGESQKFGVAVGASTHLAEMIESLPNVALCGLMVMAPRTDNRDTIYDCFMRCREIYDEIAHDLPVSEKFRHLSMGMSQDFEIGIRCGATLVRIGRDLFADLAVPAGGAAGNPE